MTRLGKMNELINKLSDEPFEYGKNDCYTFTAALVKQWHGADFSKLHRDYKDEGTAKKYIKTFGGLSALTTGTLGYGCSPEDCDDGDVVIAELPDPTLGFVFNGYGLFKTKKKVKKLKLSKCLKGWRI